MQYNLLAIKLYARNIHILCIKRNMEVCKNDSQVFISFNLFQVVGFIILENE